MFWRELFQKPTFTITSDQDWAPAWASQILLSKTSEHGLPWHVFRTNPCPVLDKAASENRISQGWHPNFLPGSSHGSEPTEVVAYLQTHFPGATTVRSHTFAESTHAWKALAAAGILADSQVATLYQPELTPLLHWTGLLRFPLFFEDDIFFEYAAPTLDLTPVYRHLFTPGLKILNFHPAFVGCNIPSRQYYEEKRSNIFGSQAPTENLIYQGRGTADIFVELIEKVKAQGFDFVAFPQIVTESLNFIAEHKEQFPPPFV